MQDKEKVIVEIMGLVSAYGSAVEATVLSEGDSREEHEEFRAYKLVESKLRELVEQNTPHQPLSYERILSLDCIYMDTDPDGESFEVPTSCIVRFARNIERAHGIIKGF